MPKFGFLTGVVCAAALVLGCGIAAAFADPGLEQILQALERRYAVPGFSARFHQSSTITSMDITDTAQGRLYVRRPGKMRWEYETPEPQVIISDGTQLWIFRPEDNQVMIGRAPEFFGDGKGASFLSDIGRMREHFTVTLEEANDTDDHVLKLVPLKPTPDLSEVLLWVSWTTFDIREILTVNGHGDRTRIVLSEERTEAVPEESLFHFAVPDGAEILRLDPSDATP